MATARQRKAAEDLVVNGGSTAKALRKAGYSEAVARNPSKVTSSKTWQELMDQYLPDKKLVQVHKKLLGAKFVDHMVFPLAVTDDEIKELIRSVGGTFRKFQHSETATHVWFWSDNTKAQKDGLELAYKLKARLIDRKEIDLRKTSDVLDELDAEDEREKLANEAESHLNAIKDHGRPEAT